MKETFDPPDISDFIAACAKKACPECGKTIKPNRIGRPRSFCSARCRWAFDKRAERRREKEEPKHENGNTENSAGIRPETGGV